jgi:CTP synthase
MQRLKYIFVSGGVISGIGKGVTTASIALLLKQAGYKVSPIKFENYLNIDAGTINPIEHGDAFLCDDGTEADMDMGTYEKFLSQNMTSDNFVTMGKIYKTVIDRERRFEYKGEDVEAIPHITDEIIKRIHDLAKKDKSDIVIIELGGTAGEYQNIFYYEASRILTLRQPGDVVHVHVGYVPTPTHLGEPKTKPTQLSIRTLNSMGIQPDFIVARSEKMLDKRRKDRFALFCNMHPSEIISNPDLDNIYEIPIKFHEQNLDSMILAKLGLDIKKPDLKDWNKLVKKILQTKDKKVNIAIIGKYFGTGEYQLKDSYAALFDAIDHAKWHMGIDVNTIWINSEDLESKNLSDDEKAEKIKNIIKNPDGIIVPIGWGERGSEGMIEAANYARINKIPYLGLCYGMQLACVAFARYKIGIKDAQTAENYPDAKDQVVHLIPSQKELMQRRAYGGTMRLGSWEAVCKKDSLSYDLYKKYGGLIDDKGLTSERHRHRYEFNDVYTDIFEKNGLRITARSVVENLAEIIELPVSIHPFYIGTQGHPEYKSKPLSPHPLFLGFLKAACEIADSKKSD